MKPHPNRLYWILQLSGWGVYTLLRIYGAITVLNLPWMRTALELFLLSAAGFGLSHWLRAYMHRHRWGELNIARRTWRIVAASFLLGVPLGIATQFSDVAGLQDAGPELKELLPNLSALAVAPISTFLQIVNWAVLYIIWIAAYFIAVSIRLRQTAELRQSELARALQLAELRLLKTQLNPHFLFNSLNTVRSLIADDPSRAQVAVTRLANTLRYTLRSGQDELVTLAQELEIVAEYLELESMRFEERLRVEYEVSTDAGGVRIPVMLLQTVVENAIKHGIAELPQGGVVRVAAQVRNAILELDVENSRPPAARPEAPGGIGLRNADERLRLLFGSRASIHLDLSQAAIVTARIRVPQFS